MSNLTYRKPLLTDLGVVFGIVWAANEKAIQLSNDINEDLHVHGAPSECYDIAFRGVDQVVKDAIKNVEAVTGLTWPQILEEVKARTGGRWLAWNLYNSLLNARNCVED